MNTVDCEVIDEDETFAFHLVALEIVDYKQCPFSCYAHWPAVGAYQCSATEIM
jgi:hypothetical protein